MNLELKMFEAKEESVNCLEHKWPHHQYGCTYCDYEVVDVVLYWGNWEIARWRTNPATYQGADDFVANKLGELFKNV